MMATAIYKDSGNVEFNTEQVQGKKTIKSIKKRYLTAITLFLVILIALALVLWATLKTEKNAKDDASQAATFACTKTNGKIQCEPVDKGTSWNATHCSAPNDKNCRWCEWQQTGPCSVSCGYGIMKMVRYCACKSPEIGPSDCIGENQMSQTCYEGQCPSDDACNQNLASPSGYFTSKGYPAAQGTGMLCRYYITVASDKSIRINFPVLSLMPSDSCLYGQLRIYEDTLSGLNLKATICSNGSEPFQSYSNKVIIEFQTFFDFDQRFYANYSTIDKVCNYTLTTTSSYISSPGFPNNYTNDVYCEYHLKVSDDKAVAFVFTMFSLEDSAFCEKDSVQFYENGILKSTRCGHRGPGDWISKESKALMVFKSDASITSSGFLGFILPVIKPCEHNFTSPTGYFTSRGYPGAQPAGLLCTFYITVAEEKGVKIDFHVMTNNSSGTCSDGVFRIYEDSEFNQKVASCNALKTYQSNSNKVIIMFQSYYSNTSMRFYANYSEVDKVCNYTLTPSSTYFSSPGHPSNYSSNAYCEYHFQAPEDKAIQVNFIKFSLEDSASCVKDSVQFYENGILQWTGCGYKFYPSWSSKTSKALMIFKSDGAITSTGFLGYFSQIEKPCEYSFTAPSGYFTSKGYPAVQAAGTQCRFNITVPSGKSVKIDFPVLSLTPSSPCVYGYLKIYEDNDNLYSLKGTLCSNRSETFHSYSNKVIVDFRSSYIGTDRFYANYSAVDKVCKYSVPPLTFFSSPGYPNAYPNNITCEYHFKVPEGNTILIQLVRLSLESSLSCTKDSIKIYENQTLQRTLCGNGTSGPWFSKGNEAYAVFTSDSSVTSSGFYGSMISL